MDNSKRWGKQGSGAQNTELGATTWTFPFVTVDLNVMSVMEKRSLANLMEVAGDRDTAARLRREAETRSARIHEFLWNEAKQYYFDREETTGRFVPVFAPTGAYPLLLVGLEVGRYEAILGQLFNPKRFFAPYPFPSLAMDDPDFRPADSYWMGPTWYSYNIYILRALFRRDPIVGSARVRFFLCAYKREVLCARYVI